MDPNGLDFDTEAMLAGLRPWVECESPTWDAAAVERMLDLAAAELAAMGATIERLPGTLGFAGCVRATLPHRRPGPGMLVMGHLDTVHPVGTLAALPWRREGNLAYGPGIMDMKGGVYAALEALRALARAGIETALPVTVLLTPDEEVGSPSTRELIEREAAPHRAVLIPEPAQSTGGVTTGRYAIARFNLRATGRPSHAGSRLAEGRSAIAEMARQILAIEAMTTPDCTFSVGVVHGGQWVNCVSTTCDGEALSMAKRQADLDRGVARMLALTHRQRGRRLRGHARRDPAGLGARPGDHGALRARPRRSPPRSASPCRMAAPAAARTAISPARPACRRWTGSASKAPGCTRWTSTSGWTAWRGAAACWPGCWRRCRSDAGPHGAADPGRSPATNTRSAPRSWSSLAFLALPRLARACAARLVFAWDLGALACWSWR